MTQPHALAPITVDRTCYRINGQPIYLYSGEFHYFRVPRRDWARRIRLFKAAGGNCLATYVPWLIHEPAEGQFRFEGGQYDVEAFLETAAAEGLYVIARPGPYQYSELKYDGLPAWLCDGYPELHAHDLDGKVFRQSSISYIHPLFLEKVRRWFAEVCPRLARHTVSRGGPIAFAQFDNELAGIHAWFGSLDYNAASMGCGSADGRYPRFLQARHGTIERLNALYGTQFAAFADVRPLAPGQATDVAGFRRLRDYFQFYLGTVAEYGVTLAKLLRQHGIDVPFVHNSAGPGMNAWFKPLAEALPADFVLGSDHYYSLGQEWAQNNPTPQYATNVFVSLETLRLLGYPPTIFELPGGSASDWPPITPSDAEACYLVNLALGMKGSNFYILTGGPNLPGTGTTTDLYDYGASIGARGEVRPLYRTQQKVGRWLKQRPWFAETEREFDFRVTLDFEQPIADQFWKQRGPFLVSSPEVWTFAHRGLVSTAFCAGLSPAFVDLGADAWLADTATPVVAVTSAVMRRADQERLVRFLQGGGRLLLVPVLPTHDENFEPCTVLADFLGAPTIAHNRNQFSRVTFGKIQNVFSNGDVFLFDRLPAGAEVLGVDELTGRPLAWQWTTPGDGQVLCLGFRWSHAKREHEAMLAYLLKCLGLRLRLVCDNPNVWCSLRTAGEQSILFVMNLLSAPMTTSVRCRPGWSRKLLPARRFQLPPMTVKTVELTPPAARRRQRK